MTSVREQHVAKKVPVAFLECREAWNALTETEKLYAHYISQASWWGSLIVYAQTSPEAPKIFDLLQALFRSHGGRVDRLKAAAMASGVTEEEFDQLMNFAATFYGNGGNYLSFGDTKIVPEVPQEAFRKTVAASGDSAALAAFDRVSDAMYSLEEGERALNIEGKGVSTYYSPDITRAEIDLVQEYMDSVNLSAYNTRLFVRADKTLEIRVASSEVRADAPVEFKDRTIQVVYGDHAAFMKKVVENMQMAGRYAANDHQRNMIRDYVESFRTGSIEAHKNSQRHWIKDVGPVVESNIGFIESYRDPVGVRGEWEGFVAVVNKELSAKFNTLVENARPLIERLPWPKEFEKDAFLRPDFTSLDVVSFASSGIPAGINIPNYDDIRQTEGFKNVSLGNVLAARTPEEKITFIGDDDQELYKKLMGKAFEVQVGIHELLGHGSGKLLSEDADGKKNFPEDLVNPLTGKKVETWYKHGETWSAKFPVICSSYEECRAECSGIYLCPDEEILRIFGHEGDDADDIVYINWLLMCRAGVVASEFYTPETKSWRQAHMQARFAILQVLLEAGQGLVELKGEGKDTYVSLDRTKIRSVGVPAIGEFLTKLTIHKATADFARGKELYDKYTAVTGKFLKLRESVIAAKQPRKVFVQAHTAIGADGRVKFSPFEASPEGMVESFQARFPPRRLFDDDGKPAAEAYGVPYASGYHSAYGYGSQNACYTACTPPPCAPVSPCYSAPRYQPGFYPAPCPSPCGQRFY